MADFILYSSDKKETQWNTGYTSTPQTNTAAKKVQQTPLIFKTPEAEKPATANNDDNSVFNFKGSEYDFSAKDFIKTGKDADGLALDIPGWSVLKSDASEKTKQELLNSHLTNFKNEKAQLAEIERLIKKGVTQKDFNLLAGTHKALKDGNVVIAMKDIINVDGNKEKKTMAGVAVANDVKDMKTEYQYPVSQDIVATKNKIVIEAGSKDVSKLDKTVQEKTHALYFDTQDKDVQRNLTEQYGQYDKSCEVSIHQKTMTSQYQEILNLGSSNIYKFSAENQQPAVQITIDTKNEAAINAAAAKVNYYDQSTQSSIKTMLASTPYSSVKETLATAPQPSASSTSNSQNSTGKTTTTNKDTNATASTNKTTTANTTETGTKTVTQEAFQKANLTEKIKMISSMNNADKQVFTKEMLKYASNSEKLALLESSPNAAMINLVVDSSPSLEVLSKIRSLINKVPSQDKASITKKLNNNYSSTLLMSQSLISKKKENSSQVGETKLTSSAKEFYNIIKNNG